MKKAVLGVAVATACVLTACSSKNDANDHNFASALSQYLDQNGDLCLHVGAFPVDVADADVRSRAAAPTGEASRMAALQAVGLVTATDISLGQLDYDQDRLTGRRLHVTRYDLTTAGRDAYRKIVDDEVIATGKKAPDRGDLCYGKAQVDAISGWDGPTQVDGRQEASVRYTYTVQHVAAWAQRPEIAVAFPSVAHTLSGANSQTLTTTTVLGEKGWQARAR